MPPGGRSIPSSNASTARSPLQAPQQRPPDPMEPQPPSPAPRLTSWARWLFRGRLMDAFWAPAGALGGLAGRVSGAPTLTGFVQVPSSGFVAAGARGALQRASSLPRWRRRTRGGRRKPASSPPPLLHAFLQLGLVFVQCTPCIYQADTSMGLKAAARAARERGHVPAGAPALLCFVAGLGVPRFFAGWLPGAHVAGCPNGPRRSPASTHSRLHAHKRRPPLCAASAGGCAPERVGGGG